MLKLAELESVLGKERVVQNSQLYSSSDFSHLPVALPKTIEELSELVKFASINKIAVVAAGGGTKLEIGNISNRIGFIVSTRNLNTIFEYTPADLVATVGAGFTLEDLQNRLQNHRQYLPIDAPFANRATLGGIVATSSYGSLRFSTGTIRDWLIGIKVVNGDGSITKAGGKVVKNVAGYDLMKLYTGSFGTLSIIGEMSFKLRPCPTSELTLIGLFPNLTELYEAAKLTFSSQLSASAIDLVQPQALQICFPTVPTTALPALAVRLLGLPEAVKANSQKLIELWHGYSQKEFLIESEGQQSWKRLSDLALYISHNLRLKISVLPSRFLQIVKLIERTFSELTEKLEITSYLGNGVIRLFAQTKENLEISLYQQATETLRGFCHQEGGSVVLELAPSELKQQVDVWGVVGSQIDLMKAIKNRLDPNSILSPGRFLTGL